MLYSLMTAIGGLGLFLIGMHLMTSGLRQLAGNRLRQLIRQSTSTPATGAATGALTTAVLQSSSATTVATVGFVSAGLMTFPQALGIIFGANIGTTVTGWMVAILGFKLKLGLVVQPLVFFGVLLHLFARSHWKPVGLSLAGFSLLFIGIDTLSEGFSILEGTVTPDDFPDDTLTGRLKLVLIGIAVTLVTQSSSAGVATALAALTAGTISFPQAAALVIGMDVGTTATAALATLGGSVASRRTGFAHVIYNIMTGLMAFCLLGPLGTFVASLQGGYDPQIALVGFHTAFNLLGVLLVVGFTRQFASLVITIVPSPEEDLSLQLDDRLLADPAAALDTCQAATNRQARLLFRSLSDRLSGREHQDDKKLDRFDQELGLLRDYADKIITAPEQQPHRGRHLRTLHALDHMERLAGRLRQNERLQSILDTPHLIKLAKRLESILGSPECQRFDSETLSDKLDGLRKEFRRERRSYRETMLDRVSANSVELEEAFTRLDAVRWLHRTTYHVWRITVHLEAAASGVSVPDVRTKLETRLETELDEDT